MGPASRRIGRSQPSGGVGQHSLLVDPTENRVSRTGRDAFTAASRHRHRAGRQGSEYNEWVQSLEDMIGTGAGQLMQQVFGNIQGAGAPLPGGGVGAATAGPAALLQSLVSGLERRHDRPNRHRSSHRETTSENPHATEAQLVNDAISNPPLTSCSTIDRWNEESAIFSGGMQASERISLISRMVTAALAPEKVTQEKEEEDADVNVSLEHEEATDATRTQEEQHNGAAHAVGAEPSEVNAELNELAQAASAPPAAQEVSTTAPQTPAPAQSRSWTQHTDWQERVASTPQRSASSSTSRPSAWRLRSESELQMPAPTQSMPAATESTATSERPSWRERVERRRQAQAAAQAQEEMRRQAAEPVPEETSMSADVSQQSVPEESTASNPLDTTGLSEVLNLAAQLATVDPNASASQAPAEQDTPMEGANEGDQPMPLDEHAAGSSQTIEGEIEGPAESDAGPSQPAAERVTIEIRGQQVDITDTGIDPTFLEALPDDMREE